MAVPVWFDENVYLSNKLTQLGDGWDMARLKTALDEAGYSSEPEGLYRHFMDFGNAENVSPSAMFNVAEYLKAKAEQLNAMNDGQGFEGHQWDEASTLAAIQAAGMSVWDHFTQFGMFENVNPSNQFDVSDYLDAKLAQLQTAEPEAGWTMDSMLDAFRAAGLNPVEHYALFGQEEALSAPEVPAAEKVFTDFNPYVPHNPGDVFTLTTGVDAITGTAADDTVNGVASSLSSARTLNPEDQIDGGDGNDTLAVDLDSNFNGFSGDGFLKNVENVTLTNTGSVGRTFSAKGVEGVDTYTLNATDAAINLTDLAAAGITVNAQGQQKAFSIGFTADAVKGKDDALTLGLNGVGADEDHMVAVTAAGIENLTVKASADNYVNLTDAASQTIAVTGSGDLYVGAVSATLTGFDASAAGGDVEADLSGATIATLKGGAGDDTFVVDKLAPTAVLEGGAGDDTLVLSGISGAVQPTISGFETIAVAGTGGSSLTISGKNVSDFAALTVTNNADVILANMNVADFAITATDGTAGSVTVADAMALTYNVEADEDKIEAKTTDAIGTAVTAGKATSATVNVGAYASQTGQLDFAAATDVTVNVSSGLGADGKAEQTSFNAILNANKADTLTVNAEGELGSNTEFHVGAASSVIVNAAKGGVADIHAAKATDVTISAGANLNISGSSAFTGAQVVTLTQNKGALNGSGIALSTVSELTVSGADESSAIEVGNLGSNTQDYDLTVSANGLAAGFTAGVVNAGAGNVVLNFADMTGKATTGNVDGAGVTVDASLLGETKLGTVTADSGDIAINALGLLGGDTAGDFALEVGAMTAANGSISVSFDGSNGVKLGSLSGKSVTLDASGYFAEVTGNVGNDVAQVGVITADTATVIGSELQANTFATSASNAIVANTLNFTGGLGVDTVDLTAKSGGTSLVATLNTGAGNDEVSVKGIPGTTKITVSGDMGGDATDSITVDNSAATGASTIDLSGLKGYAESTITGGTVADTIILGAGVDTVVFNASAGADVLKGFAAGSGGDLIDFGSAGDFSDFSDVAVSTMEFTPSASASAQGIGDKALLLLGGATAANASDVAALFAGASDAASGMFLDSSDGAILVISDGADTNIWYVENDNTAAVAASEVHLVGTLDGVAFADLDIANFA